MTVEVCVTSLESALIAQRAGAHRIELCTELALGGVTPSYGLIKMMKEALNIPVHVLIRPRSGDFTYTEYEFGAVLEDIDMCRSLGVEGIVAGVLDTQFGVDWDRTAKLVERSKGCYFTFHRAFDWVSDPVDTFLALQKMGVDTVLTSGGASTAEEGMQVLRALQDLSESCVVMPGGGIRDHNAPLFKKEGFKALHLSGSTLVKNTGAIPPIPMRANVLPAENEVIRADEALLRKVVESVN